MLGWSKDTIAESPQVRKIMDEVIQKTALLIGYEHKNAELSDTIELLHDRIAELEGQLNGD
jgi:hypothetical protein